MRSRDSDIQALRDEVSRLAQDVLASLGTRGSRAYRRTRKRVDRAFSDASERGREAYDAAREAGDDLVSNIDTSIRERPYATILLAAGIGFVIGMLARR